MDFQPLIWCFGKDIGKRIIFKMSFRNDPIHRIQFEFQLLRTQDCFFEFIFNMRYYNFFSFSSFHAMHDVVDDRYAPFTLCAANVSITVCGE